MDCGIPSITLMGTSADYESITTRLDKFDGMGPEAQAFTTIIRPIIRQYSASFDAVAAGHEPNMDFWGKSCHEDPTLLFVVWSLRMIYRLA